MLFVDRIAEDLVAGRLAHNAKDEQDMLVRRPPKLRPFAFIAKVLLVVRVRLFDTDYQERSVRQRSSFKLLRIRYNSHGD